MQATLDILKAISDQNRLRIVAALTRHDELAACQITELLGVAGATASRHLSQLHRSGIVESRKQGRWVLFRLLKGADTELLLQWLEPTFAHSPELKADQASLQSLLQIEPEELCRRQRGEDCCPR